MSFRTTFVGLSIVVVSFVVILIAPSALACTVVTQHYKVLPHFRIVITDAGRRVADVAIQVYHNRGDQGVAIVSEGRTDGNGVALVSNLPAGSYYLSVGNGVYSNSVTLEVVSTSLGEARKEIKVDWSRSKVVRSSHFWGVLRLQDFSDLEQKYVPGQILPRIVMNVSDAASGKRIASFVTDASGAFDMNDLAPGNYEVEVVARQVKVKGKIYALTESGSFPLEVTKRQQANEAVDLAISSTSCGLSYLVMSRK